MILKNGDGGWGVSIIGGCRTPALHKCGFLERIHMLYEGRSGFNHFVISGNIMLEQHHAVKTHPSHSWAAEA